jgi:hypothetical protein
MAELVLPHLLPHTVAWHRYYLWLGNSGQHS